MYTLAYPTVRILFQCSSPEKHGNKMRIKIKAMIKKKNQWIVQNSPWPQETSCWFLLQTHTNNHKTYCKCIIYSWVVEVVVVYVPLRPGMQCFLAPDIRWHTTARLKPCTWFVEHMCIYQLFTYNYISNNQLKHTRELHFFSAL